MPSKIHGSASAQQTLSGELDTFVLYARSPYAISAPDLASGVNIRVTGNLADECQKNFEVLVQTIGLRAMPVNMDDPKPVSNLKYVDAPTMMGEGFIWTFQVETAEAFTTIDNGVENPVGLLIKELTGIVLPNGTVLKTSVTGRNIEFKRTQKAR